MPLPYATPAEIGLDKERLAEAFNLLRQWTTGADAPLPGGTLLVGRKGKIVEPRFFGRQGPEPDAEPIRRDGQFLLASITKPVTYLAAMRLVERGQLVLTEPVTRYIPEFAAHHKEETLVLHLFTHTSGMPDMLPDNMELRRAHAPLEAFVAGAIAAVPLFRPGTDFSYQSMGTLVVAELVQRLTGRKIADVLRRDLFEPLGMPDMALGSKPLDRRRLVRVEERPGEQGTDFGWNSPYWQELGAPWGGLYSTPEDFAVLCQTMLNGGRAPDETDGYRLVSPATVAAMTANRLDDLSDLPETVRRAHRWGLGWRVNHRGAGDNWGDLLGERVYGHSGATGTLCWIDPERDGFCLMFTTAVLRKEPWRLTALSNMVASAWR